MAVRRLQERSTWRSEQEVVVSNVEQQENRTRCKRAKANYHKRLTDDVAEIEGRNRSYKGAGKVLLLISCRWYDELNELQV